MDKNINDFLKNEILKTAIYTFIVAWDEAIKEAESKETAGNDNTIPENSANNQKTDQSNFVDELPSDFWKQDTIAYDDMVTFAKKFLNMHLEFNEDGSKKPHKFIYKERKNLYPIQEDIVDYLRKTGFVDAEYLHSSIQSMVSRRLRLLSGLKENDPLQLESDGVIICTQKQYKPFTIVDKRKVYKEKIIKDIDAIDVQGRRLFAKLSKSVIYHLGTGGVVIFFQNDVDLSGTMPFLKKFVGESYLCDMFDIKGRMFILIDGFEEEITTTVNDLVDLVDAVYEEQNKPKRKTL